MISHIAKPFAIALIAVAAAANAAGDAQRGQEPYESRCTACHPVDENRVGPAHRGVFGPPAGGAANYGYLDAVRASVVVWSGKSHSRAEDGLFGD